MTNQNSKRIKKPSLKLLPIIFSAVLVLLISATIILILNKSRGIKVELSPIGEEDEKLIIRIKTNKKPDIDLSGNSLRFIAANTEGLAGSLGLELYSPEDENDLAKVKEWVKNENISYQVEIPKLKGVFCPERRRIIEERLNNLLK